MERNLSEGKLLTFVQELSLLLEQKPSEEIIFIKGKKLLARLIAVDDWLPEEFTKTHPQYYQQYLLYADPLERFSIVSFVWAPGQKTPVHNHTVGACSASCAEKKKIPPITVRRMVALRLVKLVFALPAMLILSHQARMIFTW
jgi:predicted metal-dependent enzyme (double-stranded beta helix superfamily)